MGSSGVGGELQSCQSGKLVRDSGLFVILDYGGSMGDSLGIHPSELRGMDLGSTLEGGLPRGSDGGPLYLFHIKICIYYAPTSTLTAVSLAYAKESTDVTPVSLSERVHWFETAVLTGVGGEPMGDSLGIHPSELRGMDLGS